MDLILFLLWLFLYLPLYKNNLLIFEFQLKKIKNGKRSTN